MRKRNDNHDKRPGRSSHWCPRWFRLALYIRDGWRCVWCDVDLRGWPPEQLGLDHLDPRVGKDPDHSASNLVLSCKSCNSARCNMSVKQFAGISGFKRVRFMDRDDYEEGMEDVVTRSILREIRNRIRRKLPEKLAKSFYRGEVSWDTLQSRGRAAS